MLSLTVTYKDRIDKYIASNSSLSRADIQELIKSKAVFVNNGLVCKPSYIVHPPQEIKIIRLLDKTPKIEAQNIKLDIIYEDDHLVIIDKPSGLIVHPSPTHYENTLANGLLYHFKNNLSDTNGLLRPGIVHRIDKDTSGLLIVTKTNAVHIKLAEMFKNHSIKRSYIAICDNFLTDKKLRINLPIGLDPKNPQKRKVTNIKAKEAITNVELIKTFYHEKQPKSLVKCNLETGRTHQIRVHLAHINNPIYGDNVYNKKIDDFNQRLHAYKLEFVHPMLEKQMTFYSKVPSEFNICEYDFELLKG